MLPVPTTTQLADFTGRPVSTFGGFVSQALMQATLLFTVVTKLTDLPADPDMAMLAQFAIMELADRMVLEQPHAVILANPYQSETIGNYTYSKSSTAIKARTGQTTGLFWWDLALDELRMPGASDVAFGGIGVDNDELAVADDGRLLLTGPQDDSDPPYVRIS